MLSLHHYPHSGHSDKLEPVSEQLSCCPVTQHGQRRAACWTISQLCTLPVMHLQAQYSGKPDRKTLIHVQASPSPVCP